ncbi:YceK/YidQ family lipoprotein [Erwinia sp. V71]|uniref:YceK/YidQ family lipoprotein n=1 Tax=Erwinia sp. V71 TaxID=3369424 RepID=UPI003F5F7E49
MKALKTYHVAGLFASCMLAGASGCSSVMSHTGPGQGYYPGTRASAAIITDDNSNWVMKPLAAIDLPFSAVMDTILLPWDYLRADKDKAPDSPRERVRQSEAMSRPFDSIHSAEPLAVNSAQP